MRNGKFSASVAVLALLTGLGGAAMAQTVTQDTPAATAAEALPEALGALNLQGIETETKRGGLREIEGRTADGVKIEAKIDMNGEIVEVEADDGALPQSLIEALLPQAIRDHAAMAQFATIDEIKRHRGFVEVKGDQANGEDVEARFDAQNALIGIEVDDAALPAALIETILPPAVRDSQVLAQFATIDEIRTRGGAFLIEGEDSAGEDMRAALDAEGRVVRFGRAGDDRKGGRDKEMRGEMRGQEMRGEHRRGDGPRGERPGRMSGQAAAPAFDAVAAQQRLADAGYTGFGFLRPDGPRVVIEATNPQGDAVLLELDAAGELVREAAR